MRVADGFYINNFATKGLPTQGVDYTLRVRLNNSLTGQLLLDAVLQPKK